MWFHCVLKSPSIIGAAAKRFYSFPLVCYYYCFQFCLTACFSTGFLLPEWPTHHSTNIGLSAASKHWRCYTFGFVKPAHFFWNYSRLGWSSKLNFGNCCGFRVIQCIWSCWFFCSDAGKSGDSIEQPAKSLDRFSTSNNGRQAQFASQAELITTDDAPATADWRSELRENEDNDLGAVHTLDHHQSSSKFDKHFVQVRKRNRKRPLSADLSRVLCGTMFDPRQEFCNHIT